MRILVINSVQWGPEHQDLELDKPEGKDVAQWIIRSFGADEVPFVIWKPIQEPEPPPGPFDGIIVSGSPASVYDGDPWIDRLSEALRDWGGQRYPIIGLCFGHQILAQAFGGEVTKNMRGWELGTCEVELTDEGLEDPLFSNIPRRFKAMESHQDIVVKLPPGAQALARNRMSEAQAIRIGENIRSVQFHPEYETDNLAFLITPRRDRLIQAGVDVDAALASIEPTPHGALVLQNFKRHFIYKKPRSL